MKEKKLVVPTLVIEEIRTSSRLMVRELGLLGSFYGRVLPTNAQCHIMIELRDRGPLQAQDLAQILRVDKSTLSRVLKVMGEQKLVRSSQLVGQKKGMLLELTSRGRARLAEVDEHVSGRVGSAMAELSEAEREIVVSGLTTYARALRDARLREAIVIRPLQQRDNRAVAEIIRTVMPEFGAGGAGFASQDPEVDALSRAYRGEGRVYLVLEADGLVLGGGGIAPLQGGDGTICELQKMYFRPELRGLGFGRTLVTELLRQAKKLGYREMYLETLKSMTAANRLYESLGFQELEQPRGATGHCGCDRWRMRKL